MNSVCLWVVVGLMRLDESSGRPRSALRVLNNVKKSEVLSPILYWREDLSNQSRQMQNWTVSESTNQKVKTLL